jgi:hypothetical protein
MGEAAHSPAIRGIPPSTGAQGGAETRQPARWTTDRIDCSPPPGRLSPVQQRGPRLVAGPRTLARVRAESDRSRGSYQQRSGIKTLERATLGAETTEMSAGSGITTRPTATGRRPRTSESSSTLLSR